MPCRVVGVHDLEEETIVKNFRSGRCAGIVHPVLAATIAIMAAVAGPARGEDVLVFRDGRVLDGATVIPATAVVIRDGQIDRLGADAPIPEGARIIDGRGKTLLPGLIDGHTQAFFPDHLKQAAIFGVTTELDMFTDHAFAARMQSEQAAGGALDRADLRSAGTLVTAPGGHGTEYGLNIPTVASAAMVLEFIDAGIAEGSNYMKIVYDDGRAMGIGWPTIGRDVLAAVIRAAQARKKLAVVHVLALKNAREAIAAGADGLVHLFVDRLAGDAFIRLAADEARVRDPDADRAGERGRGGQRCHPRRRPGPGPVAQPFRRRGVEGTLPEPPAMPGWFN
jgi:imidazolonepropionase-like amidohydrolase